MYDPSEWHEALEAARTGEKEAEERVTHMVMKHGRHIVRQWHEPDSMLTAWLMSASTLRRAKWIALSGVLTFGIALSAILTPTRLFPVAEAAGRGGRSSPGKDSRAPSLESVLRELRARSRLLTSLRLYSTTWVLSDPKLIEGPSSTLHGRRVRLHKSRWVWRKGRCLLDQTEVDLVSPRDPGKGSPRIIHWYDGRGVSEFLDTPFGGKVMHRGPDGRIPADIPHNLQFDTGIPRMDGSVARRLEQSGRVRIVGAEVVRGLKCYKLEYEIRPPNVVVHHVSWLAPERGWLEVRREITDRPTNDSSASVWRRTEVEEFQRFGKVWLPRQVVTTVWRASADGKPQWLLTRVARTAQVEVNALVQEAELVPQFSSGVLVTGPGGARSVKGDDTSALEA